MGLLNIVLLVALFAVSFAEIAQIRTCDESSSDICSVSEVRITPCRKSKGNCGLKKGTDASMSFDFTPNFATSNLGTLVYWANGAVDVEFSDFGSRDACTYTTCPTEAGKQQTLNYNLHIGTKLPRGVFTLKWKVWNKDNESQMCCFLTTIVLKK